MADQPHAIELFEDPGSGETGHNTGDGPSPVALIKRLYRGRVLAALVLGTVLAAPLAFVGYTVPKPEYRSTAVLRINTRPSMLVYETPENAEMRNSETFKQTQAQLLKGRRLLNRATELIQNATENWPRGLAGVSELESRLRVAPYRAADLIAVNVSHGSARTSQMAVNKVIEAYSELYGDNSLLSKSIRERRLEELVDQKQSELNGKRERIYQLAERFGTVDVVNLHQQKVSEMVNIRREIDLRRRELATVAGSEPVTDDPADLVAEDPQPIDPDAELTDELLEMLAPLDSELAALLDQRNRLLARREVLELRYSPAHRSMKQIANELEGLDVSIERRARPVLRVASEQGVDSVVPGVSSVSYADQLRTQLAGLEATRDIVEKDVFALNQVRNQIELLRAEEAESIRYLDDLRSQLEQLRVEAQAQNPGRVEIEQYGDLPLSASSDKRIQFAGAGLAGGMFMGLALVGGFGFLRLGFRYISDFESLQTRVPLLGVVPDLHDERSQADGSAAMSVHHLRNLLQVRRTPFDPVGKVYTMTSPTSGDGKTSLVLALGMSFAAVGHRTLVIDADSFAHGLTRQLGMDGEPGLWEALHRDLAGGSGLNGELHATEHEHLWAMPAGMVGDADPEQLSGERLARLLVELRERFDTVILDTGPLLGSLDATLSAAASDEVVLAVRRGQRARLVDAALDRLDALRIRCTGVVFNCASWSDVQGTISPVSLNFHSIRSLREDPDPDRSARVRRGLSRGSREAETG
ncbi:MAG: AAA family ATPase [Planctomycetota bacterium]